MGKKTITIVRVNDEKWIVSVDTDFKIYQLNWPGQLD